MAPRPALTLGTIRFGLVLLSAALSQPAIEAIMAIETRMKMRSYMEKFRRKNDQGGLTASPPLRLANASSRVTLMLLTTATFAVPAA